MSGSDREAAFGTRQSALGFTVEKRKRRAPAARVFSSDNPGVNLAGNVGARPPQPMGREAVTAADVRDRSEAMVSHLSARQRLGGVAILEAERLRAKGWSVAGIAKRLEVAVCDVEELFGLKRGVV